MLAHLCRTALARLGLIPRYAYLARLVGTHPTPEDIAPGWVYIVGGPDYQKWAYFRSPTGNGEIIQLSLIPKYRPCWHVTIDWLGRPTIAPSIRQLEVPYAHFWLREGVIEWCADSGRPLPRGNHSDLQYRRNSHGEC